MAADDTIFALSSGQPPAGVAVIRMSGKGCRAILARMVDSVPEPRRASLRAIREPGTAEVIDRGLVLWTPGPASFTGEDVAELHLHGGRAIVARVLAVLGDMPGARMAEAGEFSRRAFDHGKLDLTEAEGLADLIDSETEGQRRQALRQMEGALRSRVEGWRSRILELSALLAAELDFSDEEDVDEDLVIAVRQGVQDLLVDVDAALAGSRVAERIRDGVRVVIAGAPNVGKSSLMNAIVGRDVAIVSKVAGTTRDVIEVRLDIAGVPVDLVDTAGVRDAENDIEAAGIIRTAEQVGKADLVCQVRDASDRLGVMDIAVPPGVPMLQVFNKADLMSAPDTDAKGLWVSAETGAGLDAFLTEICRFVSETYAGREVGLVTRERQREIVQDLRSCLLRTGDALEVGVELAADDLRAAADAIGRLTGRIAVEEMLGSIFSRFCIGK